jgi:hypothetical protein
MGPRRAPDIRRGHALPRGDRLGRSPLRWHWWRRCGRDLRRQRSLSSPTLRRRNRPRSSAGSSRPDPFVTSADGTAASRRRASARFGKSGCWRRHASSAAIISGCNLTCTGTPTLFGAWPFSSPLTCARELRSPAQPRLGVSTPCLLANHARGRSCRPTPRSLARALTSNLPCAQIAAHLANAFCDLTSAVMRRFVRFVAAIPLHRSNETNVTISLISLRRAVQDGLAYPSACELAHTGATNLVASRSRQS